MPPFIPRKRRLSTPPSDAPTSKSGKKPSLFDTLDKPSPSTSLQDNKSFLDNLNGSESESALSDVSSDQFEDALPTPSPKRRKVVHEEEEDDEVEWEDAVQAGVTPPESTPAAQIEDLELTLDKNTHMVSLTDLLKQKKGPSKLERKIRVGTHCMHVQFLLFHNLVRGGWACDKEAQSILVRQLPAGVKKEIDKWRAASGLSSDIVAEASKAPPRKGRKGNKAAQSERNQRDWGRPAERQERGAPNMSRGDPLIRLLKVLAAYWKKRFTITAPGLRKQGYKSPKAVEEEITSWRNEKHNPEKHGECVRDVQEFRSLAKTCEGSRDVGAQLFTALVRGLGLEARLVASIQPAGFGWSKNEEALTKKKKATDNQALNDGQESDTNKDSEAEVGSAKEDLVAKQKSKSRTPRSVGSKKRSSRGAKDAPIDLSSGSDSVILDSGEDEASVIDVTPSTPRRRPNMNYDKDMPFPIYWTEVISPITNLVHPVDPLVLTPAVITSPEQLCQFESRGAKADKAKQVFAYVIAYSSDGTAKDVTTRYLKRHVWPGRTKGVRLPTEKVPVHNRRGKIKYYEDYDWFKSVMSGYKRTDKMRTVVDDLEEAKELKPVKPEKKDPKPSEDTLQGYKNSAEFVLERHLRREEALRPEAKPVKTFTTGKGDNAKEEPVFRREDVEVCRTGESWHKEGRAIKADEVPMKMVPIRAVTLTRKREVEEAERDTGEKLKQGLYSWDQTDWIIPPPIENGVIPKNAYGNIDCFVPTMVPEGAVHIPLRRTMNICKRLGIDYAEAVTGFEFGNKRAVPVITGVVVAEAHEHAVIDQWEKEEEERRIKEEGKREKVALATWRKWLMGLRIIQRVREEYGQDADAHMKEEMNPFTNQNKKKKGSRADADSQLKQTEEIDSYADEDMGGGFLAEEGGGFLPEGHDEEEIPHKQTELTIEDHDPPLSRDPSPKNPNNDIHHSRPSNLPSQPSKPHSNPNPTPNNSQPKKPKSPPTKSLPLKTGKKRKASISSSISSDLNSTNDLDPNPTTSPPDQPPSSKQSKRTAPRRKAARNSENAVKSHYFDHGSSEEEEGSEESEERVGEKRGREKRKTRGRPRRGRGRGRV
ncbi:hypothetical protein JMJ35_006001 [Cladonia borealis]|uniref:Uncharacterized protein n=1 Tax=Cladonia borealis TaxID=184061 RepID=A0AA39QYD0_9LECA|nr:hypothetical protein JMJ35_006001 [Cladonia borealis]